VLSISDWQSPHINRSDNDGALSLHLPKLSNLSNHEHGFTATKPYKGDAVGKCEAKGWLKQQKKAR